MKITGVKTTLYQYKLTRRMGDANSPAGKTTAAACLVELHTDAGLTGLGIATGRVQTQIESTARVALLGKDPSGIISLWQRMLDNNFSDDQRGLINEAISVLDIALWDLKAKANDEPLWKTLGGPEPKANVYASDVGLPLTDKEISKWYTMMASEYGIREGKLKVGLDQDADIRRLGLMRKALCQGPAEPVLMIDVDEYWSAKQAIRKVKEMETHYDLTWVEAPTRRWDFLGMKLISNGIRSAICNGEYLDARGDFLPHFNQYSTNVIQINVARSGITGALQLADAAYGFELPVTLSASPGNINAHLAGAMPYFMNMEIIDPLPPEGIFTTDVRIKDGWAVVGDRPGNGLVIDYDALKKASIDTLPEQNDSRRAGAGLYEIPPSKAELTAASKGMGE